MLKFLCVILLAAYARAQTGSPPSAAVTLDEAVQQSLARNLDLAAARLGIGVAEARRITAALRPNPVVSLSADHLDILGTGFSALNNGGPTEYAIRTDFVHERGQKRALRMALAEAETGLAELQLRDVARHTIYDVQTAFVTVQQAKENLQLAQENLKSLESIVAVNRERVRTGDLARVELDRSEVAALQYQAAVRQSELQLQQAKNSLQLLMGRVTPDPGFEVTGPIRRDPLSTTLDELQALGLRWRPDLLSARQTQARSQADLRLQIAQGKVDLTYGFEARRQDGVSGRANTAGIFLSAPLPVFNRNQGEILRAEREMEQNTARIRAITAAVQTEILSAWQQFTANQRMLNEIETEMLPRAREVRGTMEYSYRRGEASLVEFLDAQRAFNDAMQSYNESRAAYARTLYLVESVSGTSAANPGLSGGTP